MTAPKYVLAGFLVSSLWLRRQGLQPEEDGAAVVLHQGVGAGHSVPGHMTPIWGLSLYPPGLEAARRHLYDLPSRYPQAHRHPPGLLYPQHTRQTRVGGLIVRGEGDSPPEEKGGSVFVGIRQYSKLPMALLLAAAPCDGQIPTAIESLDSELPLLILYPSLHAHRREIGLRSKGYLIGSSGAPIPL